MSIVSLNGLTRPEALAALFNYAKPQGLGTLHYKPDHRMDSLEAGLVLTQGMCVDYLEGRVIKVDFGRSGDTIDTRLYDRDNGMGAGLKAVRYASDKKDGGFMGDMCLPLHIGMSEICRRDRPGIVWYEYENFMGGVLAVFKNSDVFRMVTKFHVEYRNRDHNFRAGVECPGEYFERERAEEVFKRLVRQVVSGFVDGLLDRDNAEKEAN